MKGDLFMFTPVVVQNKRLATIADRIQYKNIWRQYIKVLIVGGDDFMLDEIHSKIFALEDEIDFGSFRSMREV